VKVGQQDRNSSIRASGMKVIETDSGDIGSRRIDMAKWTDKDERQYDHIRDRALESGKSEDEAEEVAARTVNKQRRKEGRTPNKTTQGTGNPNSRLEERTVEELRNLASARDIKGRSKMDKAELVEALRKP